MQLLDYRELNLRHKVQNNENIEKQYQVIKVDNRTILDMLIQHDLDFCSDDGRQQQNDDETSIQLFNNQCSRKLHVSGNINTKQQQNNSNQEEINEPTFDLESDIFDYENKQSFQMNQKKTSIFTLTPGYFDTLSDCNLIFKNKEILNQSQTEGFSDFHHYITELGIQKNHSPCLNQDKFQQQVSFIDNITNYAKQFYEIQKSSNLWIKLNPTIPLKNLHLKLLFQWFRFLKLIREIINSTSSSPQIAINKLMPLNKIEDDPSIEDEFDILHRLNQMREEIFLNRANSLSYESIIPFEMIQLQQISEHFFHACKQCRKGQIFQNHLNKIRSRLKLYKIILLISQKEKLTLKEMKKSYKKKNIQEIEGMSLLSNVFFIIIILLWLKRS